MINKFKPSDLALVINDSRVPENIGQCVELIQFVPAHGRYEYAGQHLQNGLGEGVWLVAGESIRNTLGFVGFCQKAEYNLMPLRGDLQPEREKTKEVPA